MDKGVSARPAAGRMTLDQSARRPIASEKPRVLFFAPVPDFKGGAERSLMDLLDNPLVSPALVVPAEGPLSRAATARGVEVEVLDLGEVSAIRRPFRPHTGLLALRSTLDAARNLNGIARRLNADLVHTNGLKAHAVAVAARRLGGRPTVIHIRDIALTMAERATWSVLQRFADSTILVSRACWPGTRLPARTYVVHNGFRVSTSNVRAFPSAGMIVGFVGRIHPSKGLHVLIDALARARMRGSEASLLVRGEFAAETPDYEAQLRLQIARLRLEDHVRFDGFVADPARVYDGLSAVCVPSTTPDPLPRSVMEAMGSGLPVIAAPVGGIPEMIEDSGTGFFASDPDTIADRLLRLEADPALAEALGRRGRERCLAEFTLSRLHQQVAGIYDLMLRGASPSASTAPLAAGPAR